MSNDKDQIPRLDIIGANSVVARGCWRVESLAVSGNIARIQSTIRSFKEKNAVKWDLSQILELDYIGAQLLWDNWNKSRPQELVVTVEQSKLFSRLECAGSLKLPETKPPHWYFFEKIRKFPHTAAEHFSGTVGLVGQLMIDLLRFAKAPHKGPWTEISANIYHAGAQALSITAIVGFLIGVVLSYLSAQQLHVFGGDAFLVNLLGMSVIRELGPLLAAILVAGRSGSAMTAQLGVMRVTEELSAMQVMGMSHGFRLIMPKVIALSIVMPLLIIWTDMLALLGGMLAGSFEIGLSIPYFLSALPNAVPIANLWIGIGKGFVFGILIALIACYYGMKIKPNTESLGQGTTSSVVTSITIVILADAIFAVVLQGVGF
ncbi:ABC transporter permease [Oxalobacter aliiformigenes]|uniref:MlaE family ABC transporter permease n=1 Tax=Oxalobacter aliiformigenes TaxID=2946593 RepID=UPI0022B05F96|nr:ABC transporter permease [Oxalobacter aliiformigenes]MCZ4064871.1 ABC transporter permease [Oxalobacter aliiformigenes]WAV98982.1 ABC transporter permease [Oxalobacter aliiformigenes]